MLAYAYINGVTRRETDGMIRFPVQTKEAYHMKKKEQYTVGGFVRMHRGMFALSVFFSLISSICSLLPYFFAAKIVRNMVAGHREFAVYVPFLIAMAGAMIANNLFHKISTGLSHAATFQVLASLRKALADKLYRLPLGVVDDEGTGRLKDIMVEKVDQVEPTLAHVIPEVTGNVFVSLLGIIYIFVLDWRVALAGLAVIPIALGAYLIKMGRFRARFENYMEKNAVLNSTIVEYIHGIEVIKIFNQSGREYHRLEQAVHDAAHSAIDWMRENLIGMAFMFILFPSPILFVLPVGLILTLGGSLSFDNFTVLIIMSFGMIMPLLAASGHMDNMATSATVLKMITSILNRDDLNRPETSLEQPENYEVCFEHVTFAYREDPVVKDVSLTFQERSVNALVGPSGGGKSTLTKLLASFYEIDRGRITIGGVDIRDLSLSDLNRCIAYVSQNDYLFDLSIMENLKMGRADASDEDVREACKRCGVHDFIEELEHGYDTIVGSSGTALSGGERQRICIARAMLKDAPIIILDEATAYTDPENEHVIQESISRLIKGKTLIVVAHRLSGITDADRIFVIADGAVEASGTHEELMTDCPRYAKMYEAHMSAGDRKEASLC